MRPHPLMLVCALALVVPAIPPASAATSAAEPSTHVVQAVAKKKVPALKVKRLVTGLDNPWDVKPIGGGRLLFTQRDRATLSVWKNGKVRRVKGFQSGKVWVSGETGLTGLEVDPAFANNGRIYTCHGGFRSGGGHDVRVTVWRLSDNARRVSKIGKLIGGFPATSGRHGGCRLLIDDAGSLLIGTGDAAAGSNPRDLDSLGGKTLRINRFTGAPWPTNAFAGSTGKRRFVYTFGHRNVQGLAQRADGSLWSVEHGPERDDEVNKLVRGGDYGWHPVPGYNESVPMTDHSLPGKQYGAKWRSGFPTVATSGGTFVSGSKWGAYDGTLAVACLKASRVLFLTFNARGKLKKVRVPAALRQFGRLRSVTNAPNGDLLITTSNGGNDAILKVKPR